MPAGRKPLTDPPVEWKVSLPSSLAAQIELVLLDPLMMKAGYGKRSALIASLLRDWLKKEKENLK